LTAIGRATYRKDASAIVLGYGFSFFYQEGLLCYARGTTIRILNVHQAAQTEFVIDVKALVREEADTWNKKTHLSQDFAESGFALEIIQCQGSIVSFFMANESSSYLVAVDLQEDISERVRLMMNEAWPGNLLKGSRPGIKISSTQKSLYYINTFGPVEENDLAWAIRFKGFNFDPPSQPQK